MLLKKVYFDESGQTGAHLLDANQPYFCIGSTDIEEGHAAEIIRECFSKFSGKELKANSVFRRASSRNDFLKFSKIVGGNASMFCGAKINKRFSVVAKMVDNLVEPVVRASGYDFYAENYALKFANMAYYAFNNLLNETEANAILSSYNAFARAPSKEKLENLQNELETSLLAPPDGTEMFLSLLATGVANFYEFTDLENFRDTNDLHVTAVLQCIGFWQNRHSGLFHVVHDESTHFFRRSALWELMTNPDAAVSNIVVGDKTMKMPLGVKLTSSAKSHECPSLQLCDLIAGFVNYSSNPNLDREGTEFVTEAINRGMGELSIFPVEPGTEFVDGPPIESSGPDVLDQIIMSVHPEVTTLPKE